MDVSQVEAVFFNLKFSNVEVEFDSRCTMVLMIIKGDCLKSVLDFGFYIK